MPLTPLAAMNCASRATEEVEAVGGSVTVMACGAEFTASPEVVFDATSVSVFTTVLLPP